MEIKADSAYDVWKSSLRYVFEYGADFVDVNKRVCREVLNMKTTIRKPADGITKPITVLNGFQKWIYPPLEELSNIVLSKASSPAYTYSYGPRIFNYDGLDQINQFLIPLLKSDPNSRRGVVTVWNPKIDANVHNKLLPGLILIDFKFRKGKLCATSVLRSNDLWFGWPASLYQTFVLQDYVAKELNVKIGSLSTFSTSAHIFKDQIEYIKKVMKEK